MRELKKCIKLFWNFGNDTHKQTIFASVEEAADLVRLIGAIAKEVREDKQVRLEQFKTARKKMDEEDVEYFEQDLLKVDRIENFVMEIAGVLLYVYRDALSNAFKQHLLPHFAVTLSSF